METNHRNTLGGHNAHMQGDHLKSPHLERAARIHETHRNKMGTHGVLVEASPDTMHINLEAAYKAHHEGKEFGNVLAAMSTPHEIAGLHEARRRVEHAQDDRMPKEISNEII